jgi:hypothetical protein
MSRIKVSTLTGLWHDPAIGAVPPPQWLAPWGIVAKPGQQAKLADWLNVMGRGQQ